MSNLSTKQARDYAEDTLAEILTKHIRWFEQDMNATVVGIHVNANDTYPEVQYREDKE